MESYRANPDVRVGHVHLRVTDLDRAIAFYRDALGLAVTADARALGLPLVLMAAGDYHHHVALNTWHSAAGAPMPEGYAGLHHVAFLYPEREELGRAVARLIEIGYPIESAQDHGLSLSVYLRDPDGNGVELTWDLPRTAWVDADGLPVLKADEFDVRELLPVMAAV